MKILITGASGFIGSFLVEHALEEGMETWAAVRKTSGKQYLQDERIRFIEVDLSHDERLRTQLESHMQAHGPFDYVIHAAGATKCKKVEDFYRINTEGTARLALLMLETGALKQGGRFVFISSLSAYGAIHEIDRAPITENDMPLPNTAYGLSKLRAEAFLQDIPGLNFVVLRPTGVYGPREKDYFLLIRSINRHVDFAVGFRPQILTFIYVADLVQAAFLALTHGKGGQVFNLSDGKTYTSRAFSDLVQMELGIKRVLHITAPLWLLRLICTIGDGIGKLTGKLSLFNSDKYRILKQRNWQCSIRSAREELSFTPKWPLVRGVKASIDWYKNNHWL